MNLIGKAGTPYDENSDPSILIMRELALRILYNFSEINGYGKFIIENLSGPKTLEILAENLSRAKEWCEKQYSDNRKKI